MLNKTKKLNIGTKILIPIVIMTILSVFINSYSVISQMNTLVKQTSSDSLNMLSDSIFITLRNAMNTGDSKIIQKAEQESRNNISGLKKLEIAKSQSTIQAYGSKDTFTKDKDIINVFKTKQNMLIDNESAKEHSIRILRPMIATQECLACHTDEKDGSVIAVLDLTFDLTKSDALISDAIRNLISTIIILLLIILPIIYLITNKGIITPLYYFQDGLLDFFKYLNREKKDVKTLEYNSNDEIGAMIKIINSNISKAKHNIELENQSSWIKEGVSGLNKELSTTNTIIDVSNKSISYICRYIKAGVGALYYFNEEKEELNLYGSFAYTQRQNLSNSFKLGEATIGQVALEKAPILLKNIQREQLSIVTGTTDEAPINTYTFPLMHQDKLVGVIEIGSNEIFDSAHEKLLEYTNTIIATALFSAIQNEKVKDLLTQSQEANKTLKIQQTELENKNTQMQEQQAQLEEANSQMQEQQAELEESNSQMQEQQAQLEEANAQMEEQQLQLKHSEKELKVQNAELEESKEELRLKAKALEESNKYKSEFLANMSHELRTPLNSVILLSSMLKQNKKNHLSEDEIKKADIINSSGEELLRLINDVLDLSKVEAGRMELLVESFNSTEFATSLKDLFEASAQKNNLEFIVEDRYNKDISNDKDKLSQILRNFLSNSLKFTQEGSISLIIEPYDTARIKLSVKDTGIGIAKDKQDLVFKAFQQADGSTSRKYGGTGLGLSITKELVKLMQGEITLESELGNGSTFSIIIPNIDTSKEIKTQETPTQEVKKEEVTPPKNEPKQTNEETQTTKIIDDRKKILPDDKVFLIIEDDEGFALTLKSVINENDDLSLIASSGKEGIKLAKEYDNIQGILLDLGLPDMDGVEVLKELKSNINTRKIPVYILSGRDSQNQTKLMGAVGFKQKPLSSSDLQSVFDDFIKFNDKKVKDLLIVEDNDIQREAMIEFIGDTNINSHGVASVNEAIDELKKDIYDAIVVDLTLKEGSGLKICEYIKNNKIKVPIIVYTGKEITQEEENEIKRYTDSIIVKSANSQNRLLDEVDMFLHRVKVPSTKDTANLCISDVDFSGKKIMVVDDDMRNTYVLMEILEEKNADVITASNGQEAIDTLNKNPDTNIILMDIMMPVMNGYEAIQKIKADEKTKNIPIIAVTAKAMNEDKQRCLEVGANDFLTKPLNLDTFTGVIKAWIK